MLTGTTRRVFIAAGSAALATTPFRRADARNAAQLRVGVIPGDFAAQPYYAQDEGFFTQQELAVDILAMSNGPASAAAVASGALDFAYSNIMSLAVAHERGLRFSVVALANIYAADAPAGGMLSVKRSSPIAAAKDFSGKTIAVGGINNITQLGARAWIDANGGDSSSVHWIEIQVSAIAPAVLSGRVDGGVMDPGVYPTLGKPDDPIRVVGHVYDAVGRTFASGGWFTTLDWLANRAPIAHRFAKAMADAGRWANTHHHASAQVLAKHLGEQADQIDALVRYAYGAAPTPAMLQPSIDLAAKYGLIRAAFPASELFVA